MPYPLKFTLYLLAAGSVAFTLAGVLKPLGRGVNLLFAVAATYLVIIIGRRLLGILTPIPDPYCLMWKRQREEVVPFFSI